MEKETTTANNKLNDTPTKSGEANQNKENQLFEESTIPEEQKKLSLSDINPSDLTGKIENFFSVKLETLESKFHNDLAIVEPFKFEFIDLYHDLENLKQEILDFLKEEEEKKTSLKKPTGGAKAITRTNTSRSRTPIKFNATASKIASTKDVTKSTNVNNLKSDLDKSRSRTPLTAAKPSEKSRKDVSVTATATKKTLNTTANAASTLNTPREVNTTTKKQPAAVNSSAKQQRDLTPAISSKGQKVLDTSAISHNEPAQTSSTGGIKGQVKANVASAILKKPKATGGAAENINSISTSGKRKASALNLTSSGLATAEVHGAVSSFNSSLDVNVNKKKSILGGLNTSTSTSVNLDLAQGYSSNNNLVVDNNNNNCNNNANYTPPRASVNKGSVKGERKASMPAQRGSISANKRSSVELKNENLNASVDEKRDNDGNINNNKNPEEAVDQVNVNNNDSKRKSIEVRKIEIEDKNHAIITIEKRQSIKIQDEIKIHDNTNPSEKTENDVKVAEERKKSVVAESIVSSIIDNHSAAASAESKNPEEFKVEINIEQKETNNETKSLETNEPAVKPSINNNTEAKSSNSLLVNSLLLSFSNKKNCAIHLLIKSG